MKNKCKRETIIPFNCLVQMHCVLKYAGAMFVLFVFSVQLSLAGNLADINISIEKRNVAISEILDEIEKQSGYNILVRSNDLDINEKATLVVKNKSLDFALKELLKGKDITFMVEDKNISIFRPQLDSQTANKVLGNERRISGIILDELNEPLIGASVSVVGHNISTISDVDGLFSLNVPLNVHLEVSYIGYKKKYVSTKGKDTFNVVMEEDSKMLEEVVAIGYGTITRKEMTSAISHVSSKDFLNIGSSDPMMQIQGKVAGLSVANEGAGDPNSMSSLQIRGIGSRSANADPLIVIDGIPGGSMQNLNSNDIESIDVLKDGAAAAIYGTRGGAGVILITTKKNQKSSDGAVRTSYSGYTSVDLVRHDLKVLNAEDHRDYRVPQSFMDHGYDTNWLDAVSQNGFSHSHFVSLAGGTMQSNYRVSFDYRNSEGIDKRSDREEYGGRLTFTHINKSKLLELTANVAPRMIRKNWSAWSVFDNALKANPTLPIMDPKNEELYMDLYIDEAGWNPVEKLKREVDITESKFIDWDATVKLNIFPLFAPEKLSDQVLNMSLIVGESQNDNFGGWFRPSTNRVAMNAGVKGEAKRSYSKDKNKNVEWLLNYVGEFKDHRVRFTGGYSFNENIGVSFSAENKDFDHDALTFNDLGNGAYMKEEGRTGMSTFKGKDRLVGFFGRVNYDFKQKYLFTASYRYEGSSKFGANNKWGHFPAVSGAWRISEELFMKDIDWLSELKVRADFGVTGNSSFGRYNSLSTMRGFGDYTYDGDYFSVWGYSKNANPDLKWEKGNNWNIGLDFGLLKNRIHGSLNYYYRKQTDLLGSFSAPVPSYPFDRVVANVGSMKNNGFEVDIAAEVYTTKDFSYSLHFTGASNNNKFLSFSNSKFQATGDMMMVEMPNPGSPGNLQVLREGHRVGDFYTYKHAGFTDDGDWLVWNKDNTEAIRVSEASLDDKRITGNGLPKYTLSLGNNFTYGRFDLSIFFRGALGFDIFNVHDLYYGLPSTTGNVLTKAYGKNAHIVKGENVLTDYFMEKGDYVKLDVVTLGYRFDLKNKWVDGLRVYVTGKNLATITDFSGVDPSTYQANGIAPGTFSTESGAKGSRRYYPSTTQVLFGLQLDF